MGSAIIKVAGVGLGAESFQHEERPVPELRWTSERTPFGGMTRIRFGGFFPSEESLSPCVGRPCRNARSVGNVQQIVKAYFRTVQDEAGESHPDEQGKGAALYNYIQCM